MPLLNKPATTDADHPAGSTLVPGVGRVPFPAYHGDDPFIFVSYAHSDAEIVYREIRKFHEQGYPVWYDEGIAPGNEWTAEIAKALNNCSLFVVMITPDSVASDNVKNEINFAVSRKKPFIAIHLKPTVLPDDLELQIGTKQAILKYNMTEEEYVYKYTNAFDRFGFLRDNKPEVIPPGIQPVTTQVTPGNGSKRPLIIGVIAAAAVLLVALVFLLKKPSGADNPQTAEAVSEENSAETVEKENNTEPAPAENTTDSSTAENVSGNSVQESSNEESTSQSISYEVEFADGTESDNSEDSESEENTESETTAEDSPGADDYLYSVLSNGVRLDKYAGDGEGVVIVPEIIEGKPVTEIGEKCFQDCSGITEMVLPGTLTTVGYRAFYGCSNMTVMNIPESLAVVGGWSFAHTGLTEVVFSEKLKKFEYGAFYGCSNLRTVVLSSKIKSIGEDTFGWCSKLESVTIPSESVTIHNKAFHDNNSKTTLIGVKGSYTEKYAKAYNLPFEEYAS